VPDRHGDGSNVLAVPTGAGFSFSYGPGSFDAHRAEARRLELAFEVIDDPDLAWDVDGPDDLPFDWRDLLPLDEKADPER
jgi:2-phospho-L-lactate guanylyltransferase